MSFIFQDLDGSSDDEYIEITEGAEDEWGYGPPNSHRLEYYMTYIGDVLAERYRIDHKLGFGGFSTVWLAHDMQEKRDIALKILVAGKEDEYRLQNELVRCVPDRSRLVIHTSSFHVHSKYGQHRVLCLPLIGPNIEQVLHLGTLGKLKIARSPDPTPNTTARLSAAKQLLMILKDFHAAGLVHDDLNYGAVLWEMKPLDCPDLDSKYMLLGKPKKRRLRESEPGDLVKPMEVRFSLLGDKIYLCDFGSCVRNDTPKGVRFHGPCEFGAPERFHGANPTFASDMWSYMYIFVNMYFVGHEFHMWPTRYTDTFGPLPTHWKGKFDGPPQTKGEDWWYDHSGATYPEGELVPDPKKTLAYRLAHREPAIDQEEQDLVRSILEKVFRYEPTERITAADLLQDPGFNKLMEMYNVKV